MITIPEQATHKIVLSDKVIYYFVVNNDDVFVWDKNLSDWKKSVYTFDSIQKDLINLI